MATSWNIPALINKIASDIPGLNTLLKALLKWDTSGTEDIPTGAKRMTDVTGGRQLQQYDGASWGSTGKLIHDVDMLDGFHASQSQTAGTIPVRNANGAVPGNITGNAATATEASSLANDYVVPVANGGTGANTEAGARQALGTNNAANITTGVLATARGGTGRTDGMTTDVMLSGYNVSATSVGELGDAAVKDAVDADTLTVPGVYFCINTTIALHYPIATYLFLRVYRYGTAIYQTALQRGGGSTYIRQSQDSGASWSGWQPVDYRATTSVNIYISKDGSDTNTGLSADSPVLTVGAAYRIALGLDISSALAFCFGPGDWGNVTIFGNAFSAGVILVTNYAGGAAISDPGNMPRFGTLTLREGHFNLGNIEADTLVINDTQILSQYYFVAGRVSLDRFSHLNLAYPCKIKFVSGMTNPCFQVGGQSMMFLNSAVELESGLTNSSFLDAYRGAQLYINNNFSYTGTFSGTKYSFRNDVAIACHSTKSLDSLPGTGGSGECTLDGIPTKATALATARTIQTNLGSTDAASFDGTVNVSPGVTGVLPIANGGTGSNTQNFVDLSSNQTIGGAKTFTTNLFLKNTAPAMTFQQTDITKGTRPASNQYTLLAFSDSQGTGTANRIAALQAGLLTNGSTYLGMYAYKNENAATANSYLGIYMLENGTAYAVAPTPAADDNSTKIATTGWVNANGFGLKTGDFLFTNRPSVDGFLVCIGSAVSRTTYANLFALIGTTYGAGDGSTTFNVPDMRAHFLEGCYTSAGIKMMNAGLPNITGEVGIGALMGGNDGKSLYRGTLNYSVQRSTTDASSQHDLYFDASKSSAIYGRSTTVQPASYRVYCHIKY